MSIENVNQGTIRLECKKQITKLKLLPFFLLSLIILFLALKDAIEANKMVSIECNKIKNECVFKENDYILGQKQIIIPFNTLDDAYVKYAGTARAITNYDLIFPSSQGDFKLYDYVSMKSYLEYIAIEFNIQKNNPSINVIQINPPFSFHATYPTIMGIALLFALLWVVVGTCLNETILIDKTQDELIILFNRVIWAKKKKIRLSQIKSLYYKKDICCPKYSIEYYLNDGKSNKLLSLKYKEEDLKPIYNQLNEFIFGIQNIN